MKNLIMAIALCFMALYSQAQVEIKINPIAVVVKGFQGGVEYAATDRISGDFDFAAIEGSFYFTSAFKYYFKVDRPIYGFHIGIFGGGGTEFNVGMGFLTGYKWLAAGDKVAFEIGGGVGRSIKSDEYGDDILPYFKLHVGFRFNTGKN